MALFGGYGSDYRRVVLFQRLLKGSRDDAYAAAVGGAFDAVGAVEAALLDAAGLGGDSLIIDIGCGAGRLATALRDRPQLSYLGIDVVPELIDHARAAAGRPDWRFERVAKTEIPAADASADFCAAFSVFTHLPENVCLDYLAEMRRVLRPGGRAVFSFLDPAVDRHRRLVRGGALRAILTRTIFARNVGYAPARIEEWAGATGFKVNAIESPSRLGQSLAVFEKPA